MCVENKVVEVATIKSEKGGAKNLQTSICCSFAGFIDRSGRWLAVHQIIGKVSKRSPFAWNKSAHKGAYNGLELSEMANIPSHTGPLSTST